jgi:glycosyltransferase involved in cell wall biosynthesis
MGRNPTREMHATADDDPRIEVTGLVADANAYLRAADVMAVPLIEGHGTRFKVLEAFASRLPVLSTRKGIEGIDAQAGEHYLAAESDQDFVEQLARLASEPRLADALVRNALELVRAQYSLGRISEIVSSALDMEPVT